MRFYMKTEEQERGDQLAVMVASCETAFRTN